jgi:hypothetical protein
MQQEKRRGAVKTGQRSHVSRTEQRIVQQDRCASALQKLRRLEAGRGKEPQAAEAISMAPTIA